MKDPRGTGREEDADPGKLDAPYQAVFGDVSKIIDAARESAVRSANAAMTAAYWSMGRRIVELEQVGEDRAEPDRILQTLCGEFDHTSIEVGFDDLLSAVTLP